MPRYMAGAITLWPFCPLLSMLYSHMHEAVSLSMLVILMTVALTRMITNITAQCILICGFSTIKLIGFICTIPSGLHCVTIKMPRGHVISLLPSSAIQSSTASPWSTITNRQSELRRQVSEACKPPSMSFSRRCFTNGDLSQFTYTHNCK